MVLELITLVFSWCGLISFGILMSTSAFSVFSTGDASAGIRCCNSDVNLLPSPGSGSKGISSTVASTGIRCWISDLNGLFSASINVSNSVVETIMSLLPSILLLLVFLRVVFLVSTVTVSFSIISTSRGISVTLTSVATRLSSPSGIRISPSGTAISFLGPTEIFTTVSTSSFSVDSAGIGWKISDVNFSPSFTTIFSIVLRSFGRFGFFSTDCDSRETSGTVTSLGAGW